MTPRLWRSTSSNHTTIPGSSFGSFSGVRIDETTPVPWASTKSSGITKRNLTAVPRA